MDNDRHAFYGVASSAASRNDEGTSLKISMEEIEEVEKDEKEIVAKALDGQRYPLPLSECMRV